MIKLSPFFKFFLVKPAKKKENPFCWLSIKWLTCLNDKESSDFVSASFNTPFPQFNISGEVNPLIFNTSVVPSLIIICSNIIISLISLSKEHSKFVPSKEQLIETPSG